MRDTAEDGVGIIDALRCSSQYWAQYLSTLGDVPRRASTPFAEHRKASIPCEARLASTSARGVNGPLVYGPPNVDLTKQAD
jgi:hypothetical protein